MQAIVFPGQGAQFKGMGEGLFEAYEDLLAEADNILGYSIRDLCLEDLDNKLGLTQYTQPALYVVNALSYLQLTTTSGFNPAYLAGHSLGEYSALFAAQVFDFKTGLKLVAKRGELMSQAEDGGMAAVVGLDEEQVQAVIQENKSTRIRVANYNTPEQFVVAGSKDEVVRAEQLFMERGAALYRVLNVSGAFHSSFMSEAGREFGEFIAQFTFAKPQIPVISNRYARPYEYEQAKIKQTLVSQIDSPVKWSESVRYLMGKSVKDFKEVGPTQVLTRLIDVIRKQASPLLVTEETPIPQPVRAPENVLADGGQPDSTFDKTNITAESLGSTRFKQAYGLKYAYVAGGMYMGVASKELVVSMCKAGMLSFFGSGGLHPQAVEEAVVYLKKKLDGHAFGVNLLCNASEDAVVDVLLRNGVHHIEAAAFIQITPALVKYRLKGLRRDETGREVSDHLIMAKLSRPEVATNFLSPAPPGIVNMLLEKGEISPEQAEMARHYPMADHLCTEADSAGHTDQETAYALLPTISRLRDEMVQKYGYANYISIGAAGGIGAPEAAAAAFVLGADFILTGSINQCTQESGTSTAVKDMLQQANVQDMDYAPAGDMFELGAKVQVLRRGVFFPARANKLYSLYRHYDSLDDIDPKTREQIEQRYFKRSFEDVYEEVIAYFDDKEIEKAATNPKHKMALVFRWYCMASSRYALQGDIERKVDFQIHCSPAMGAFNQWVKGSELESWHNRRVDDIGLRLMEGAAEVLNLRYKQLLSH